MLTTRLAHVAFDPPARSVAGPLQRVTLLRDPVLRLPTGSAYVEYAAPDARNKALALNQSLLLGHPVTVLPKVSAGPPRRAHAGPSPGAAAAAAPPAAVAGGGKAAAVAGGGKAAAGGPAKAGSAELPPLKAGRNVWKRPGAPAPANGAAAAGAGAEGGGAGAAAAGGEGVAPSREGTAAAE